MKPKQIILTLLCALWWSAGNGQGVTPTAVYVNEKDTVESTGDFEAEAPLDVTFRANPTGMEGLTVAYEWHFRREGDEQDLMVRYEEDTSYRFLQSGSFLVTLTAHYTDPDTGADTELPTTPIKVTISESKLEFPNAFSPNGDGINDIYRAKQPDGYRSIVEFHAYIFNRWGQKLFEWTNPAEGWDGTYKGTPVKQGVYFVLVKAKGADGRTYTIKKDVNLLRGFSTDTGGTTGSTDQ